MGQLEDFLKGTMLPEVSDRLLEEWGKDEDSAAAGRETQGSKRRQINDDDREWLRRLTGEPGWQILMWLIDSTIEARQESAILLSQTDPIANRDMIAHEWTYVAAMKEVARILRGRVKSEIEELLRRQRGNGNGEVLGE